MKFSPAACLGLLDMNAAPAARTLHLEIDQLIARLRGVLTRSDEHLALTARITPLGASGPGESRDVRLADLSQRGLAIEHPCPLAQRRAMLSLESPALGKVTAEIDLSWCRYRAGGRYTSGGRLVQVWQEASTPPG